jgi:hypothetical protein
MTDDMTIPVVYITMQVSTESMDLALIRGLWAFGVFLEWIYSYMSSSEIRKVSKVVEVQPELKMRMDGNGDVGRRQVTMNGNNGNNDNSDHWASLELEES